MKKLFRRGSFLTLALIAVSVASVSADAQTKRKKRTPAKSPVVLQQPAVSDPQIISRAEDFPDGSSRIVTTVPPQQSNVTSVADDASKSIEDLEKRIKSLEAARSGDKDEKQKRLLLNLDILTRAEERAATLRKQLFDMIDKESAIKTRLELIDNDLRPEAIERSTALVGSLRPEEIRAVRRKNLEVEKANLESLLTQIQQTKTSLDLNTQKADAMVEKLRTKLEKDIDSALDDDTGKL